MQNNNNAVEKVYETITLKLEQELSNFREILGKIDGDEKIKVSLKSAKLAYDKSKKSLAEKENCVKDIKKDISLALNPECIKQLCLNLEKAMIEVQKEHECYLKCKQIHAMRKIERDAIEKSIKEFEKKYESIKSKVILYQKKNADVISTKENLFEEVKSFSKKSADILDVIKKLENASIDFNSKKNNANKSSKGNSSKDSQLAENATIAIFEDFKNMYAYVKEKWEIMRRHDAFSFTLFDDLNNDLFLLQENFLSDEFLAERLNAFVSAESSYKDAMTGAGNRYSKALAFLESVGKREPALNFSKVLGCQYSEETTCGKQNFPENLLEEAKKANEFGDRWQKNAEKKAKFLLDGLRFENSNKESLSCLYSEEDALESSELSCQNMLLKKWLPTIPSPAWINFIRYEEAKAILKDLAALVPESNASESESRPECQSVLTAKKNEPLGDPARTGLGYLEEKMNDAAKKLAFAVEKKENFLHAEALLNNARDVLQKQIEYAKSIKEEIMYSAFVGDANIFRGMILIGIDEETTADDIQDDIRRVGLYGSILGVAVKSLVAAKNC